MLRQTHYHSPYLAIQATWHRGYWLSDMSMECFTGQHMRWSGFLGVPLLVITTLSMPLISLGLLLYHRGSLDLTSVRLRYGFIYSPYRSACKAQAFQG